MLYLTGGLVLGEWTALWITAEFGINGNGAAGAALWLVAACAMTGPAAGLFLFARMRAGAGKRIPEPVLLACLLATLGWSAGAVRMETETRTLAREERIFEEKRKTGVPAVIEGRILKIAESADGCRITVRTDRPVRRVLCYLESSCDIAVGRSVRVTGKAAAAEPARNPGGFDFKLYCRSAGIGGVLYGGRAKILDKRTDRPAEDLRVLRGLLARRLESVAGEDAALLKAMLLGDREGTGTPDHELFRRNGIAHLLAISGLHISILGLGLWKALRKCGAGYGAAGFAAFVFLLAYGGLTGFAPSAVRAVAMAALSFAAAFLGRTYDMPSALCVPALYLLWRFPYLITQAGFQLSFLAAGAIAATAENGAEETDGAASGRPALLFVRGLFLQLMTAPAVLWHMFEIPLYAMFLNLIAVPLMGYAVVSGGLGLALSFVRMPAGTAAIGGAHYILAFYRLLCRMAERLPWSALVLGRPKFWQVIGSYLLLAAGLMAFRRQTRRSRTSCAALWLCAFLVLFPLPRRGLSVTFLDVGQGDGIVLEAAGRTVLIDCGGSKGRAIGADCLVPFLKSGAISRLDAVVATHGDSDHTDGIRYLLSETADIRIGRLVLPRAGRGEVYEELERLAAARGIPVERLATGERLENALGKNVRIVCLGPDKTPAAKDRNAESLVLSVRYGDFTMLLTGDTEAEGERKMIADGLLAEGAPYTVLKAAHHGSATSTTEEFLREIRPLHAVLSYGRRNRYGHPSPEVLDRLEVFGVRIWETAGSGAIRIQTDGKKMRIRIFVKETRQNIW